MGDETKVRVLTSEGGFFHYIFKAGVYLAAPESDGPELSEGEKRNIVSFPRGVILEGGLARQYAEKLMGELFNPEREWDRRALNRDEREIESGTPYTRTVPKRMGTYYYTPVGDDGTYIRLSFEKITRGIEGLSAVVVCENILK